ncbi:MAG: excalibur calcium-binding domain-containing protein [Methylococcaceae bacterium]
MKKIVLILILIGLGQFINKHYQQETLFADNNAEAITTNKRITINEETITHYKCDGRTHCSQMTSCEEASFFLQNCPGTKMDGNNDGIPCEKQWCK